MLSPYRKMNLIKQCSRIVVSVAESLQNLWECEAFGISVKMALNEEEALFVCQTVTRLLRTLRIESQVLYEPGLGALNVLDISDLGEESLPPATKVVKTVTFPANNTPS
jgi:hypothetical protein